VIEPYWHDEGDWLCTIEFLPCDDPEGRLFGADIVGYLVGYAQLTNTRVLALIGDPDASAYELLLSFSSPEQKNEFLNLVRSNEYLGNDYIIEFTPPTAKEIKNARPPGTVLPHDALTHAMLIAATLCVGAEDDRAASYRKARRTITSERFGDGWTRLSDGQETQKTRLGRTQFLALDR
jgi:hypothetical protein